MLPREGIDENGVGPGVRLKKTTKGKGRNLRHLVRQNEAKFRNDLHGGALGWSSLMKTVAARVCA